MCWVLNAGTVCVPVCGTDALCAPRVCDPRGAICRATANTGIPHGPLCDPDAPDEDGCMGHCQGFQIDNQTAYGLCTTLCSLGGKPYEMQNDCNGYANGVCLFKASVTGAGDWGACVPRCTAHDACGQPHNFCRTLGISQPGEGFCYFVTECPNGNECAGIDPPQNPDYQWQCTTTALGDFCLEVDTTNGDQLVFPFTSMGTGGAGGGGGTGGGTTSAGGAGGAGGN
jgi:hypothetical protein